MWPLSELQAGLRAAVVTGELATMAPAIIPDRPDALGRLQIYRNHYVITLTEALAATYPVVRRLVGERFFDAAARRFVTETLPTSPCLFEYGAGFSAFLAELPAARLFVYLPDVARLEWAIHQAWHADDAPVLTAEDLQAVPAERWAEVAFRLHPSCQLISSSYPIAHIWHANQPDTDDDERVNLSEGGVLLFVLRHGTDVVWREVSPTEFAFLRALRAGRTLGQAHSSAIAAGDDVDLAGTLAALLELGGLTDLLIRKLAFPGR